MFTIPYALGLWYALTIALVQLQELGAQLQLVRPVRLGARFQAPATVMPSAVALRIRLQADQRELQVTPKRIRCRIGSLQPQEALASHIPQRVDIRTGGQQFAGNGQHFGVVLVRVALGADQLHGRPIGDDALLLLLALEGQLLLGGAYFEATVLCNCDEIGEGFAIE